MRVRWTKRALTDLSGLASYISIDNPRAALATWDRIDQRLERLGEHPELGRKGRIPGTRELIVTRTPYLVVYRIGDGIVKIERVLHGAQRWPPRV
ncbi:MAG: type II toxin-antitoxin system RelE/ParE family toxin [Alphaproteobacteria bacterium]